jgi:hypothetical protein
MEEKFQFEEENIYKHKGLKGEFLFRNGRMIKITNHAHEFLEFIPLTNFNWLKYSINSENSNISFIGIPFKKLNNE